MKQVFLLNSDDNTFQVEEEEKQNFLRELLENMGLPISDFWQPNQTLNIQEKIKLRNILGAFNIVVIDNLDGHMQVYHDDELIGEWNKCKYKLKKDLRQIDPKKQFYLEMEADFWTIFNNEI
jgi:hypothetical protein